MKSIKPVIVIVQKPGQKLRVIRCRGCAVAAMMRACGYRGAYCVRHESPTGGLLH
jgi:hypothetical protein